MKEYFLGTEYEISSAGGETGQAFIATKEDEKFFLKRNSSPFLAALSAENIVPKLVWTRRVENGDVITAQKWVDAHILSAREMSNARVAKLLSKIHRSKPLQQMLQKIENSTFSAEKLLYNLRVYEAQFDGTEAEAFLYLEENKNQILSFEHVVCHGDMNHNNWMVSQQDELYLVDWDSAMLADHTLDLSMLLYQYIPRDEWERWLNEYGEAYSISLHQKLKWYGICQTLTRIYAEDTPLQERKKACQLLKVILDDNEV